MTPEHEPAASADRDDAVAVQDHPEDEVRRAGATYLLGRMILIPLTRLIYRPRIEGRANVPKDGPIIVASNHLSFIDSIAIPVAAPRRVHFLAKSS